MANREQQAEKYEYKCVQCGNCCRAGFEVVIEQEDIERWIKAGKQKKKLKLRNKDLYSIILIKLKKMVN